MVTVWRCELLLLPEVWHISLAQERIKMGGMVSVEWRPTLPHCKANAHLS